MIPFIPPTSFTLIEGVLEFHLFGILVGIGVLTGTWLAQKRAENTQLDPRVISDMALWTVVLGFIFAHLVSLFFYFPERVFGTPCAEAADCLIDGTQYLCAAGRCDDGDWMEVLKIWHGISSFGGFLGAAIGVATFLMARRIVVIPKFLELVGGRGRPMLKYCDCLAYGFAAGWFFGRMGCFTAHDHIGQLTNSFLAVKFPDTFYNGGLAHPDYGGPGYTTRFDLGMLEMLWSGALFLFYHFWAKGRSLRPGWYVAVMMMLYAPFRFYLDTLRATDIEGADKRYFADLVAPGLTPGQIGAVLLFGLGVWIWMLGGKRMKDEAYMAQTDEGDYSDLLEK